MVSDSELVKRLVEVLESSDLNTTTANIVRRSLEEHFGIDLYDRKKFISQQIDSFLLSHKQKDDSDTVNHEYEEDPQEDQCEQHVDSDGGKSVEEENKTVKKKGGGFTKVCALSPVLQNFVGVAEMARTEVVKRIWAYIKENNLQNPEDRRIILCDETLHAIFGVKSIGMFKMNKVLAKHIWSIEDSAAPAESSQKKNKSKRVKEEDSEEPMHEAKRKKGGGSGFTTPLPLSGALVDFFGTGENALSRAEVVKRMWDYIKQNNLQDPSDRRIVICDDKLKGLFEVDTFHGFSVSKLLTPHFIKRE